MTTWSRTVALLLLVLTLPPAAAAQGPGDSDTPSLTTEDVQGPPAIQGSVGAVAGGIPTGLSLEDVWERIYQGFSEQGMPPADLERFRSRINAGGSVSFGFRFDVDANGQVRNLAITRPSGIGWIDRSFTAARGLGSLGPEFSNTSDVRIDLDVSKETLRVRAGATAPTVEAATEFERQVALLKQMSANNGNAAALSGLNVARQGATVTLSFDLPLREALRR